MSICTCAKPQWHYCTKYEPNQSRNHCAMIKGSQSRMKNACNYHIFAQSQILLYMHQASTAPRLKKMSKTCTQRQLQVFTVPNMKRIGQRMHYDKKVSKSNTKHQQYFASKTKSVLRASHLHGTSSLYQV